MSDPMDQLERRLSAHFHRDLDGRLPVRVAMAEPATSTPVWRVAIAAAVVVGATFGLLWARSSEPADIAEIAEPNAGEVDLASRPLLQPVSAGSMRVTDNLGYVMVDGRPMRLLCDTTTDRLEFTGDESATHVTVEMPRARWYVAEPNLH